MAPKSYLFEGKQVPGHEVEFESRGPEPWVSYILADGTTLKVKVVLLSVARLEAYNPDGNPVYQFAAQQIVAIDPPDDLKRKPS